MTTLIRPIIISLVIGLGFLCVQGTPNQKHLEIEKQIWQLEEKYWDTWVKGNIENYMSLLHEDFIGWPSSLESPADKDAAREFVQNYITQSTPFSFEIKPAAIKIIANVSIVHYSLISKDKEGNQIGDSYRITHTWVEQDGIWKVMGGMSSKINDD